MKCYSCGHELKYEEPLKRFQKIEFMNIECSNSQCPKKWYDE
jgi:hypothetical protein